jgi:hypothetical protein
MKTAAQYLRDYGWYSGHMLTCVRNNNGLESMWKYFKSDCTTYKRCNLIILLRRVISWVEAISESYGNTIPEADRRREMGILFQKPIEDNLEETLLHH